MKPELALLTALLCAGCAAPPGSAPTSESLMDPVFTSALSGDMSQALRQLQALPETNLNEKARATRACMLARFSGANPGQGSDTLALPPKVAAILAAYRRYWADTMLHKLPQADAETRLLRELKAELPAGGITAPAAPDPDRTELDLIAEQTQEFIEKQNVRALTGRTLPFYELMLWRTNAPVTYDVDLPERKVNVKVVFLDDFVSLGWAAYATCDRAHTGGWTADGTLFAVKNAYELGSESFKVSYLTHEGQHFADNQDYAKLSQPELEYRAKLSELAKSSTTTLPLLFDFAQNTGADRNVPHDFANYWVIRNLSFALLAVDEPVADRTRWGKIPPSAVRNAALALLIESSAKLQRMGASTTAEFLPKPIP